MKTKFFILHFTFFLCLLCGCSGLNQSVVTITQVRHSVMNELGAHRRAGLISDASWQRVVQADAAYRAAARTAELTLTAYRDSGAGDPAAAIASVKAAVFGLLDILTEYSATGTYQRQLEKASKL